MMRRCLHCNQYYNVMERIGDFVHECNINNEVLGYDDILHISGPGWNDRGLANGASPSAKLEGADVPNRTPRGRNADTHRIVRHEEYIQL